MDIVSLFIAAIIAIPLGIIYSYKNRNRIQTKGAAIVKSAKAKGCYTTGELTKSVFLRGDVTDNRLQNRKNAWMTEYTYHVDGHRYTYRSIVYSDPVQRTTIYYLPTNPGNGVPEWGANTVMSVKYGAQVLSTFICFVVIYFIVHAILT